MSHMLRWLSLEEIVRLEIKLLRTVVQTVFCWVPELVHFCWMSELRETVFVDLWGSCFLKISLGSSDFLFMYCFYPDEVRWKDFPLGKLPGQTDDPDGLMLDNYSMMSLLDQPVRDEWKSPNTKWVIVRAGLCPWTMKCICLSVPCTIWCEKLRMRFPFYFCLTK